MKGPGACLWLGCLAVVLVLAYLALWAHDPRLSLMNDVSAQLKEHFGEQLYDTVIPRNIRLAEAPSYGMPALAYDKNSRGAIAYLALAGELVRRQRRSTRTPQPT